MSATEPSSPSLPGPPSLRLRRLLEARARLREELIQRVCSEAPTQAFPAGVPGEATPGGEGVGPWTPDQVLQHLERVEALVLARIPAAAQGSRTGPRHWLGRLSVRLIFLFRIRVRMPTPRIAPGPPGPSGEAGKAWAATSALLDTALAQAEARDPGAPTMVHPVSGPLDPVGTARFLLDHARHHRRQVDRLLRPPARRA